MAWRRQGDKPLSEPMMAILLTHILSPIELRNTRWYIIMIFVCTDNECEYLYTQTPYSLHKHPNYVTDYTRLYQEKQCYFPAETREL